MDFSFFFYNKAVKYSPLSSDKWNNATWPLHEYLHAAAGERIVPPGFTPSLTLPSPNVHCSGGYLLYSYIALHCWRFHLRKLPVSLTHSLYLSNWCSCGDGGGSTGRAMFYSHQLLARKASLGQIWWFPGFHGISCKLLDVAQFV